LYLHARYNSPVAAVTDTVQHNMARRGSTKGAGRNVFEIQDVEHRNKMMTEVIRKMLAVLFEGQ